jgi:hypothetical protein
MPTPTVLAVPAAAPPTDEASPLGALVLDLSSALSDAGIPHAFQRGHRDLPHLPLGSDVDLALRARDLAHFRELLRELCAASGARVLARHDAGGLRQHHLHARDSRGGHHFLDLDVHLTETCLGVPFLQAEDLLPDPPAIDGLPEAAPAAGAWADLLGAHLSLGHVKPAYRAALAARSNDPAVLEVGARLFGTKRARALLATLEDGARLQMRARADRRVLLLRAMARTPFAALLGLVSVAWASKLRPIWRPRGLSVAFLGTDGAGKTTLLDALRAQLDPSFRSAENGVLKLRPGWLPQLDRIVHLGRTTQGPSDWSRPHRARPSGRLVSNLRVLYYGLDYSLGYLLRVVPRRRRNSLLIFDRWFDDFLVDPKRCRVRPGTLTARLLSRWLPSADAVIVVSASLEHIRERKQELTEEESARQIAAYERLAGRGGRYHLIRNDGPLDETLAAILDALFPEAVDR